MDIQRNPGPDNVFLRPEDQNCDYNGEHANFAITKIIYSKQQLYSLRSKYRLPSGIYHVSKKNAFSKIVENVLDYLLSGLLNVSNQHRHWSQR